MRDTIAALRAQHGGIDMYLDKLGFSAQKRERLRRAVEVLVMQESERRDALQENDMKNLTGINST
jgi:hypothetical protein